MRNFKRGITIIEALVVVASIFVIVSIILPIAAQFRESGKRAVCLSHMRQYGVALKLYENDWMYLPKGKNNPTEWDEHLDHQGYIQKGGYRKLFCPTFLKLNPNVDRTYALPARIFSGPPNWDNTIVQTSDIKEPNITILLAEVTCVGNHATELCDLSAVWGFYAADINRHTGGANYLFFDCHAAWHRSSDSNNSSIMRWEE